MKPKPAQGRVQVYVRQAIENGRPIYQKWFKLRGENVPCRNGRFSLREIKRKLGDPLFNAQFMNDPDRDNFLVELR